MKKIILFILSLMLTVSLFSCNKKEIKETKEVNISSEKSGTGLIDYDWSKMNYNMLSSIIFDVLINPDQYSGKRIKVSGNYYTSLYEGKRYFSVLTWDATGCCPAGFDFIPPENLEYPDSFPEIDEPITVIGTLNYSNIDSQDSLIFQAEEIIIF